MEIRDFAWDVTRKSIEAAKELDGGSDGIDEITFFAKFGSRKCAFTARMQTYKRGHKFVQILIHFPDNRKVLIGHVDPTKTVFKLGNCTPTEFRKRLIKLAELVTRAAKDEDLACFIDELRTISLQAEGVFFLASPKKYKS